MVDKTQEVYLVPSELGEIDEELLEPGATVILLNSDTWGQGAFETGRKLMEGFLAALAEAAAGVRAVVLVNRGVLLGDEGPARHSLDALERQGVEILVCSVSAREHGVVPIVGRQVALFHIVQTLLRAKKVITP
ncbi:MAG: hypothetical protein AB1445_08205 [Bacillota bacterium]